MVQGYHNDELRLFRKFDSAKHEWVDASQIHYDDMTVGYDFRGSLYHRATNGTEMMYEGSLQFQGHPVEKVYASAPETYDRDYLFEKESGLLFLYTERTTSFGEELMDEARHVDWRAYAEYQPVGRSLIVSEESYQHHGTITLVRHYPLLIPATRKPFVED